MALISLGVPVIELTNRQLNDVTEQVFESIHDRILLAVDRKENFDYTSKF